MGYGKRMTNCVGEWKALGEKNMDSKWVGGWDGLWMVDDEDQRG